ncbi:hypothetical protein N656DRAFT_761974 [Canariomyces notabilis]|uniref:Uncharacterized protein n=1 Tax=Canariomyces notabilis TaxID=2074819 RepID=A0AAN6QDF9_9PEZI|nr:hypothetical protein N656DRAFT_761974 [Canariomyces arenarius]
MCQPPSDQAVRDMLGPVLAADTAIKQVRPVQSLRPQRIYKVDLSDGRTLHLVLPPVSIWRPLRFEQGMVSSEAAAVRWISETLTRDTPAMTTITATATSRIRPANINLSLPTLLYHGQGSNNLLGSSYAVYLPPTPSPSPSQPKTELKEPTPLALLPGPPLSPQERHAVDKQTGALFRRLAKLTSPSGRFGPLAAVVPPPTPNTTTSDPTTTTTTLTTGGGPGTGMGVIGGLSMSMSTMAGTGGAGSWSVAFHSLLEGILRDGEDMAVVLGYSAIRRQFRRLGYLLDEVSVARLVVVDGADEGNVLVRGEVKDKHEDYEDEDGQEEGKGKWMASAGPATGEGEAKGEGKEGQTSTNAKEPEKRHSTRRLRVTGLADWSSCVFGDPLLATVFSDPQQQQPPSAGFLEGFNNGTKKIVQQGLYLDPAASTAKDPQLLPLDGDIIEDVDTAWIRLLLYQVYHAVVHIVREFYQPRPDSRDRELEARRKLNEVLARLAEVHDDAKKKHPRPSGEMSPAKRIKADAEEG